jgi:hypothetical protein
MLFRISSYHSRLLKLPLRSMSMQVRKSVCLFGLSGDPPTGRGGHGGIVQALTQMDEFDEIRVMPVFRHTFAVRHDDLSYSIFTLL